MEAIQQLKQAINKLEEQVAENLLFLLLQAEQGDTEKLLQMMADIKKSLLKKKNAERANDSQTVHIVFGESAGGSLKYAFRDTPYEKTESVIVLPGNLSVGPINALHTKEGLDNRFQWLKNHFRYDFDDVDLYKRGMEKARRQIEAIQPHQQVIVWTCGNAAEQTGLRFVYSLLKEKENEIKEIDTLKAYREIFSSPAQEEDFYPRSSGELNGEQLLLFYERLPSQPMNHNRRKSLCTEGENLLQSNGNLRVWKEGEIHSEDEDYGDAFIIDCARRLHKERRTHEFMKAARLIGEVIGHMVQYTGDEWIEYRLRSLIEQGSLEYRGELHAMRYYEVRLKESLL